MDQTSTGFVCFEECPEPSSYTHLRYMNSILGCISIYNSTIQYSLGFSWWSQHNHVAKLVAFIFGLIHRLRYVKPILHVLSVMFVTCWYGSVWQVFQLVRQNPNISSKRDWHSSFFIPFFNIGSKNQKLIGRKKMTSEGLFIISIW